MGPNPNYGSRHSIETHNNYMNIFYQYHSQVALPHMNEKILKTELKAPGCLLSGRIKNFKSKYSLLQTIYSLEIMTGQRPQLTKSKRSVASFQLKKNTIIGYKIHLRSDFFFSFFERCVLSALPRSKDLQGFSSCATRSDKDLQTPYMTGFSNLNLFSEMDAQYHIFKNDFGINLQLMHTSWNRPEAALYISHFQSYLITDEKT